MRRILLTIVTPVLLAASLCSGCSSRPEGSAQTRELNVAVQLARGQLLRSVEELGDSLLYPRATGVDGRWKTVPPRDWTSGFFPGCLWYMSELSGELVFHNAARRWTAGLADQQYLTSTHDVGFIMSCSFGNGYRLTSDSSYVPILLQAARSLASRYNKTVGCVRSWDNRTWEFPVIIDNMMNLELFFWASKHGGTKEMYEMAFSHALLTMKNHFRPDGSTYHVVDYDTVTGAVRARETHQGYSNESVWARGQAWAIYGFTMAYRETKDERFRETAERAANWYLSHLPQDMVPYWDFDAPGIPNEPRDVSAAAIASSALLELSTVASSGEMTGTYMSAAENILGHLASRDYLADASSSEGILKHGTGNYPRALEVDVSLIYADYYFLEAISRYQHLQMPSSDSSH